MEAGDRATATAADRCDGAQLCILAGDWSVARTEKIGGAATRHTATAAAALLPQRLAFSPFEVRACAEAGVEVAADLTH